MTHQEMVDFYDKNKECIHLKIKSDLLTKPLWRRLFWTTGRDSEEYKAGCVEIYQQHFQD